MLVVSPLIALMVDQVTSLRKRSVNCSARVKSIESTYYYARLGYVTPQTQPILTRHIKILMFKLHACANSVYQAFSRMKAWLRGYTVHLYVCTCIRIVLYEVPVLVQCTHASVIIFLSTHIALYWHSHASHVSIRTLQTNIMTGLFLTSSFRTKFVNDKSGNVLFFSTLVRTYFPVVKLNIFL